LLDRHSRVQNRKNLLYVHVAGQQEVGVSRPYNSVFGNAICNCVVVRYVEVEHGGLFLKSVGMEVKRRVNNQITGLTSPQAVDTGLEVTTFEHQCKIGIRMAVRSRITACGVPGYDGGLWFH
jgi:hypothetical protein